MKCPMLMYEYLPEESPTQGKHSDCVKEECAWWDEEKNCCSIKVVAKELTRLQLKWKVKSGDQGR